MAEFASVLLFCYCGINQIEGGTNGKERRKKIIILVVILLLLLLFAVAVFFLLNQNGGKETAAQSSSSASSVEYEKPEDALVDFFSASTLHLKGSLESVDEEGVSKPSQSLELWKDGDSLRVDYDIDGSNHRTLLVKDDTAQFYYYGSGTKNIAVIPASAYLEQYLEKNESNAVKIGDDPDYDGVDYLVTVDKLYEVEGSPNSYYIKDITYCVGTKGLIYIRSAGNVLDVDGEIPTDLYTNVMKFDEYEFNVNLEDSVFKDPF